MKTFKQFQEQLNKPSVEVAAKVAGKLGGGLALGLKTLSGVLRGKHKNRRIFKKDIKQQKSNTSVQDIGL